MVKLFFKEILGYMAFQQQLCLIGMPSLLATFWKTLWKLFGTTLKYYLAFHPQIDGQTEVVNCSLSDLLRCLVGDKLGN